jgi:hypothetical protein
MHREGPWILPVNGAACEGENHLSVGHYEYLDTKHAKCRSKLIRVRNSATDDMAYCPNCYGFNDYERARNGAALLDGSHVDQKSEI